MRLHAPLAVAAVTAVAAFAPSASASDPICVGTAGDGKHPLRSSACVWGTPGTNSYTINVACSLLADRVTCAVKPVVIPTP